MFSFIVVIIYVVVSNIIVFSAAVKTQQWTPFARLSGYRILLNVLNGIKYYKLRVRVCIIVLVNRQTNLTF
jgi:hypothetical protein